MKMLPSAEYLRECFSYDAETGALTWRKRPDSHFANGPNASMRIGQSTKIVGRPALNVIKKNGYRSGTLDGVGMYAHRAIWKMVSGSDPEFIDHINGDRTDNRIQNLRSVDHSTNMRNCGRRLPPSGVTGVFHHKNSNGWQAQINTRAGTVLSFYSKDKAEAVEWRQTMEIELGYTVRSANV